MTKQNDINFLFIHGAGGTRSKWRNLIPFFKNDHVETIDLPGRNTNKEPLADSIQANAESISQQVNKDTIVIGHSMGGLVGIELASINRHVKGLVLVSSFYELPVHPKVLENFDQGTFPDSIFYASYNKDIDEEILKIEEKEKDEADMNVVSTDFHACNNYKSGKDTLANLAIPILSIYGKEDRLLPSQSGI